MYNTIHFKWVMMLKVRKRIKIWMTTSRSNQKHCTPSNEYNRPHRVDKVFVPITMIFTWVGLCTDRIASLRLLVLIDWYISVDHVLTELGMWTSNWHQSKCLLVIAKRYSNLVYSRYLRDAKYQLLVEVVWSE